jgi:hypothetical protein
MVPRGPCLLKAQYGFFSNELKNEKIELESQNLTFFLECFWFIFFSERLREEEKSNPKARESKMLNFNNKIYNKGIVYGNNVDKINYILENKLNENNEEYYKNFFNMFSENTIPKFLEDIKNII